MIKASNSSVVGKGSFKLFAVICVALILATIMLLTLANRSNASASRSNGFDSVVRVQSAYFQYQYSESDTTADAQQRIRGVLDQAKAAGADVIEVPVAWAGVDIGDSSGNPDMYRGRYIWEEEVGGSTDNHLDFILREIEARGMKATIRVEQAPDWIHPYLKDSVSDYGTRHWYPPRGNYELGHYSTFVRNLATHLETTHPGLIDHYQTWNEPNNPAFWRPSPGTASEGPRDYIALQRAGYLALKGVDPSIEVATAGISLNNYGYLNAYYDAAAAYPEAAENRYYFDTLAVHPYVNPYDSDLSPTVYNSNYSALSFYHPDENYTYIGATDGNFTGFEKMYNTMAEREGGTSKPVFLGEFGYNTPNDVSDSVRAGYLKSAHELARQYPYIKGMSWYSFYMNGNQGANGVACPVGSDSFGWTMLGKCYEKSATYNALVASNSTTEVITDNDSPAFRTSVNWTRNTSFNGRYLKSAHLSPTSNKGTATWRFKPPKYGKYRLYARWPSGNYDASVKYTVQRADNTWITVRVVDQTTNPNRWVLLGEVNLDAVYEDKVRLSDDGSGGNKQLAADAVKIEPVG